MNPRWWVLSVERNTMSGIVVCCVQLTSTDSSDSDVIPDHGPIIVADCHDIISGHRALSRQSSTAACELSATNRQAVTDLHDDTQPLDLTQRPTSSHSQILLLNGQRYEILPLGDGHWVSRDHLRQPSEHTEQLDDEWQPTTNVNWRLNRSSLMTVVSRVLKVFFC